MNTPHSESAISAAQMGWAFCYMAHHVSDYAIFLLDKNGCIRSWSKVSQAMKGYEAEEAVGQFFGMLYTDEDQARGHPQHNLADAAQNGTYQEEAWRKKKDGSLFWALVEVIAIREENGEISGFCKVTRDLSERKALQDQIIAEKERAQITLGAIGDAVISTDAMAKVTYLNPMAEQLTGWNSDQAIGRSFSDVMHVVDEVTHQPLEHQLVALVREGLPSPPNAPALLISRDGTRYSIEDTVAPINLSDGRADGAVIVFRDVTQSRKLLNTIRYQATHDSLTGLFNRIEFENRLERSLKRAHDAHSTGAVLYMDLDQFKIVNDTCGHAAGDRLLQQLANLYLGEIRDRDTLARLGGDEFALIVDHCTPDEAHAIASKILQSTCDFQFVHQGRTFKVGISIGLVMFDQNSKDKEEVLLLADRACYVAKEKGRNQIHHQISGESNIALRNEEISWISRLQEALRSNQLQLHYQPIVRRGGIGSGTHCEVLLRLNDPQHGIVMPGAFLPVAERYGLMPVIDRWVIQAVAQWLSENREHIHPSDLYAINLSAPSLVDESLLADITKILLNHNIAAGHFCFEIEEANAATDLQKTRGLINGVRALGCRVSLSGFGKGMGSFLQLKNLQVDYVKIDTSIVSVVADSLLEETTVRLVHEIACITGTETIAGWVEDEATATTLSRIGIDYLQGNWISHPKELESRLGPLH